MELLLCIESREVRMVGIWGMAGIGDDLEKRGFLGLEEKFLSQLLEDRNLNIKGLSSIKARLHFKKVLIVIDDVNSSKILEVLVGKHDWFGQGSRIIVTKRNKHLLVMHGVDEVYEVRKLNNDDALELFSHYAFKQVHPQEDYVELSKRVMVYAQGLPLALKVLGSFLFSKSKHEWESELAKLRRIPNMEIQDVLQATEEVEAIFLDLSNLEEILFTTEAFARMNRLRLLKVYKSQDPEMKPLSFDFNPKCLVDLSMPYSHIKQLWKGVKVLDKLKFMELSNSKQLTETPDFSGITNLERYFPSSGKLESLQILILSGCSKLEKFPEIRGLESEDVQENYGNLEWFKKLYSNGTAIRGMPSSISLFRNLVVLSFGGCSGPPSLSWSLPRRSSHSIDFLLLSDLCSLQHLDLSHCNLSEEVDLSKLGLLSSLKKLNLSGNNFVSLPSNVLSRLSQLTRLDLHNCRSLQALLELPSSIQSIDAHNCTSLEIIPNQSIYKSLYHASFMNCFKLMEYQSSLETLFLTVAMDATETDFHLSLSQPVPFNTILPGSGIPDWIGHQSTGHVWLAYAPVSSSIKWHEVNHIQASFLMITHMLPVITRFTPEDLKTLREDSLPQILRESTDTAIQLKGNSSQNDIYSLASGSFAALRSILDLSSWSLVLCLLEILTDELNHNILENLECFLYGCEVGRIHVLF
ncbi:putative disease resistance protein [Vitis vinifera]|uniref:Putative disease resistance protein n=1 Tax=Vitis vinifera TaxID=29760 RepID=A0A438FYE3_VITVI|nr:putative disease resistance protein [Vitis vinifera]